MAQRAQRNRGNSARLPLALCIGEPAGIGPEIIVKAWAERKERRLPPFLVIGDGNALASAARQAGVVVSVRETPASKACAVFDAHLPVLPVSGSFAAVPGKPDSADAALVCEAIEKAAGLCIDGICSALVTAPINKKALYDAGFSHPGHTEFLEAIARKKTAGQAKAVMMLAGPDLRTVPVTIHISLASVASSLTTGAIVETARIVAGDLAARFGLAAPRLAVAGLNPHAGEDGSLGREDREIIAPAIEQLRVDGINAVGPLPADTMFHQSARRDYDAAICMYHDQAMIPAKMLAFDEAVNVTLGLPFIRTSPDHGTAFDIAGTGKADPSSLMAAIRLASDMAECEHRGVSAGQVGA